MPFAPGVEKEQALRDAGFGDTEINQWKSDTVKSLGEAGFQDNEVKDYFGVKDPDMTPVKEYIEGNLKNYVEMKSMNPAPADQKDGVPSKQPKEADSFLEALSAGFQTSVTGLKGRGKLPDVVLPEHADTFYRIASQVGQLAGDFPAMVPGAILGAEAGALTGTTVGAVAGSVIPGAGTIAGAGIGGVAGGVIGGGAGAMAMPEAIRTYLMDHYKKGDIKDFGDFWERSSAVFLNARNAGIIGGATAGMGGAASKVLSPLVAPATVAVGTAAAEIGTMVTVGKAMEGQVPTAQDFVDAAIMVGGLGAATHGARKLMDTYAKTGQHPSEVALSAQKDPILKQELLSDSTEVPKSLGGGKPELPNQQKPITEPIKSTEPPAPPTAQEKILAQIGEKADAPKKAYTTDDFYKDFVDKYDPIQTAQKQLTKNVSELKPTENPYLLARTANDYKAKAKYFFEKGVIDYTTGEKVSKSFDEIVKPFKENINELKSYLVSKRAVELEGRGIKSGFDVEAAKQVVAEGGKKFEKAAQEFTDFQNGALKYLKDAGVLSDKSFEAVKEANQNYVSFKRVSEEGSVSGSGTKGSPIKKIKGSDLKIQDPFLSALDNTETYLKLAEQNKSARALVDLAEKTPDQTLIEKVPTPMKPVKVTAKELSDALKEQGIEGEFDAFTIFRGAGKSALAKDEFEVYRDGKREVYRTTDPNLAESFRALEGNAPAKSILFKIASGITAVKRIGISLTPDFILKNIFRDQLTKETFSQTKAVPFIDTFKAMGDIVGKSESYYDWLKSGGANGAFLDLGAEYLKSDIFKLNKEAGNFIERAWNVAQTPIHYMKLAGELGEQATRLAEFKRVVGDNRSKESILKGGYAAREITVDFQRMGAKVSAFNAITAFSNVQLQGLDRTVRAVKDNPTGTLSKAAVYITAPSVLLWWANKDDQRYKEIPQWQKDTFWIIPTDKWVNEEKPGEANNFAGHLVRTLPDGTRQINKGNIWRLPKPQELGLIFASLPERLMEKFFTDNPKAMKEFDKTVLGALTPSLMPDAFSPFLEQLTNHSFFTSNPIVPQTLESQLPQYQYTHYTSETAKALGKIIGAVPYLKDVGPKNAPISSPMVIDNYVQSWTGSLGRYAVALSDKGLVASGIANPPTAPEATLSDIPIIKAFVARYPNGSTKSIQDFRDNYAESAKVVDTYTRLLKEGNVAEAQKILGDPANEEKRFKLKGFNDAIIGANKVINNVWQNPKMDAHEKRQLIDAMYFQMIEMAKAGNQTYQEITKQAKARKQ